LLLRGGESSGTARAFSFQKASQTIGGKTMNPMVDTVGSMVIDTGGFVAIARLESIKNNMQAVVVSSLCSPTYFVLNCSNKRFQIRDLEPFHRNSPPFVVRLLRL
jgi:hypothetical protein